jgi:hypothetical protein
VSRPPRFLRFLLLSLVLVPGFAHAAAQDVQLTFGSLPSAQGWLYAAVGSHAGALEASVYSVSGGILTINSMGQGFGVSGGSILYSGLSGLVTSTETKELRFTARSITFEGSGIASAGQQCVAVGFNTGSVQYDISITPTKVYVLGPAGSVAVAGTYDNSTTFHDYVLTYAPPSSFQIYRDAVLIHSGSGGFAASGSRVFFGDGTGGGNAHTEVTALRFLQGSATTTAGTTWGRIKELYR